MIGVGTFKTTERARRYVNAVLSAERLSYGPFTQKFEAKFAAAHDSRYAVMTSSGTCALLIALAALKSKHGWADGDEVIVPAVTFISTSNVVLQLNLKPVFVDVDPVYYELDPDKLEAALSPRTRCLIPVHLFGLPCDMGRIMSIARKRGLRVVEDSCETMFARLDGRSVGAFGDIGCFSTYVAHILSTGVGGLCVTSEPDLAVALRSLMNHGRDSIYLNIDDDKDKTGDERRMIIERRFRFTQMGYSFRVTELEGALGLAELEEHDEMMRKRRENGRYFTEKLRHLDHRMQLPAIRAGATHSFMMFPVVLRQEGKAELVNFLEANGIETRDMLPLTNQPFYRERLGLREEDYPVAKWINDSGFYFASHQGLSAIEKRHIVDTVAGYFSRQRVSSGKRSLILMARRATLASRALAEAALELRFEEYLLAVADGEPGVLDGFRERGFLVVQDPDVGKGGLLRKAIRTASCEHVVVMGLDGCDNPRDANDVVIQLRQGADLVIASRFLAGGGRESRRSAMYRSIGNRFFTFLLSILYDSNLTDCNNLFRGFKRSRILDLPLVESGEGFVFEMTTQALRRRLKLAEIPTIERETVDEERKRNRFLTALSICAILARQLLLPSARTRAAETTET